MAKIFRDPIHYDDERSIRSHRSMEEGVEVINPPFIPISEVVNNQLEVRPDGLYVAQQDDCCFPIEEEDGITCISSSLFSVPGNKTARYKPGRVIRVYYSDGGEELGWVFQSSYISNDDRTVVEVRGIELDCSRGIDGIELGTDPDLAPWLEHQQLRNVYLLDDPTVTSLLVPRHMTQEQYNVIKAHIFDTINRANQQYYGHMRFATEAEYDAGTAFAGVDALHLKRLRDELLELINNLQNQINNFTFTLSNHEIRITALENAEQSESGYISYGHYFSTSRGYVTAKIPGAQSCFAFAYTEDTPGVVGNAVVIFCGDGDNPEGGGTPEPGLAGNWYSGYSATNTKDIMFMQTTTNG